MATVYESLDDFDRRTASAVDELLHPDERFRIGIPCWDFTLTKRSATKLILTDQRVISFKRGFIKQKQSDFLLERVTSIGFTKGYLFGYLRLSGSGATFRKFISRSSGRAFAAAIRKETG